MRFTHLRIRYGRAVGTLGASTFSAAWSALSTAVPVAAPLWRPPCDVLESADAWTLRAELAGLAEEELEIALYEDSVVIQGTRPWPGVVPGERVHLAELRYGPFRVELALPDEVDRDAVRAGYDRGLLTVLLPKLPRRLSP
jgi:HSP20 family protein